METKNFTIKKFKRGKHYYWGVWKKGRRGFYKVLPAKTEYWVYAYENFKIYGSAEHESVKVEVEHQYYRYKRGKRIKLEPPQKRLRKRIRRSVWHFEVSFSSLLIYENFEVNDIIKRITEMLQSKAILLPDSFNVAYSDMKIMKTTQDVMKSEGYIIIKTNSNYTIYADTVTLYLHRAGGVSVV